MLGVGAILARSASAPTCHTKISQITKFYSFVTIFANTHISFLSKTITMIDQPIITQQKILWNFGWWPGRGGLLTSLHASRAQCFGFDKNHEKHRVVVFLFRKST